jgi:hypothetical protein
MKEGWYNRSLATPKRQIAVNIRRFLHFLDEVGIINYEITPQIRIPNNLQTYIDAE